MRNHSGAIYGTPGPVLSPTTKRFLDSWVADFLALPSRSQSKAIIVALFPGHESPSGSRPLTEVLRIESQFDAPRSQPILPPPSRPVTRPGPAADALAHTPGTAYPRQPDWQVCQWVSTRGRDIHRRRRPSSSPDSLHMVAQGR
jgi:hypothetical protein